MSATWHVSLKQDAIVLEISPVLLKDGEEHLWSVRMLSDDSVRVAMADGVSDETFEQYRLTIGEDR